MTQATIQSGSVYGELALLAQQHDESLFEVWESLGLSEKDVTVLAQNDLYAARSAVEAKRETAGDAVFALYLPEGAPRTQYALRFHEGKPELYYPVPLLPGAANDLVYGAGRYAASCLQGEAAFKTGSTALTAYVPDFAASLNPADVGSVKTVRLMGVMLTCRVSDGRELGEGMTTATFLIPTEYTAYFDFRARVTAVEELPWLAKPLAALSLEVMLDGRAVTIAGYGVKGGVLPAVGDFVAGRLWLEAQVP